MSSLSRSDKLSNFENNMPSGKAGVNPGLYMGYVKDNDDAQTMGRLKVWVPEFGSKEDDENGWRVVNYCSPFGGATPIADIGKDLADSDQTQTSYGMWMIPPDLDNQVIVFFLNGDPAQGYWMGCVYQQGMNSMVPEMPSETDYQTGDLPSQYVGTPLPTSEYNKNTTGSISTKPSRPINKNRMRAIAAQGLIRDTIRGQSNSSSKRAGVAEVYGISTPGPINPDSTNQKGRYGGHSLVMDDNIDNEHVTLRTRSGAQLRIDETNGFIYLINKDGTGWIQIDADGNGDIFCANDLSLRALRDFNIRADRDVNIEAGRDIGIKASKDNQGAAGDGVGGVGSGSGGKIHIEALDSMDIGVTTDLRIQSASWSLTSDAFDTSITGNLNLESGTNLNVKGGANLNMEGGATVNIKGAAAINADAGAINLNSGASSPATAAAPSAFEAKSTNSKDDNLKDFEDMEFQFDRKTQTLTTTVSRLPTFEPCPEHSVS